MLRLSDDTSADLDRNAFDLVRPLIVGSAWRSVAPQIALYAATMSHAPEFWKLEHLPDVQLLESLQAVLLTKRRALAELIAHLGEVEERRLHLLAAHGSMFDYCVSRLSMSEDEACRRIDLARLARKFPALFGLLATGELSLSVALLLKPVLTADNQLELFDAARGKSMRQTRELLAARFPSPDAPKSSRRPSPPSSSTTRAVTIPQPERRAVFERDGLACTWVDADGTRCASRAWLELDHRQPRARGGSSEAENLRILCRAHNQLAAELEYGRAHMDRARAHGRHRPMRTS